MGKCIVLLFCDWGVAGGVSGNVDDWNFGGGKSASGGGVDGGGGGGVGAGGSKGGTADVDANGVVDDVDSFFFLFLRYFIIKYPKSININIRRLLIKMIWMVLAASAEVLVIEALIIFDVEIGAFLKIGGFAVIGGTVIVVIVDVVVVVVDVVVVVVFGKAGKQSGMTGIFYIIKKITLKINFI